ncbi:MAG: HlyD family efflux transporter periplasmic adaptor subunit [Pseudomonadales bacterium]
MAVPFENTLDVLRGDASRTGRWLTITGALATLVWIAAAFYLALPVTVASIDGRIVSAADSIDITSASAAPITNIPIKLGERVEAGQVLIEFDSIPERLALAGYRERATALNSELSASTLELKGLTDSLVSELESQDRGLERLEARIGETNALIEHAVNAERLYSELRAERRIDALEYSRAKSELEAHRRKLQEQMAEMNEMRAQRQLAVNRNETLRAQLMREQAGIAGEIAEIDAEVRRLSNRIEELQVRAPLAGQIGAIARLSVGQSLSPGDWVMTLVPDQSFEFRATFSAREAAGRIEPGQRARVQFFALPWTEYGTLDATVIRVASEERDAEVRVDLDLEMNNPLAEQLDHGLKGQAVVQIHEATLARRLLNLLSATGNRTQSISRL